MIFPSFSLSLAPYALIRMKKFPIHVELLTQSYYYTSGHHIRPVWLDFTFGRMVLSHYQNIIFCLHRGQSRFLDHTSSSFWGLHIVSPFWSERIEIKKKHY